MKTENKYYVPTIEEFHVGFEYETASVDCNWCINDWNKAIAKLEDLKTINEYPNLNKVKYLDKEDVEILGFTYDNNAEPYPGRYVGEDFQLPLAFIFEKDNGNKQWILYLFSDNMLWIEYTFNCGGEGYVFKGYIKNKSELKKLLMQLTIL